MQTFCAGEENLINNSVYSPFQLNQEIRMKHGNYEMLPGKNQRISTEVWMVEDSNKKRNLLGSLKSTKSSCVSVQNVHTEGISTQRNVPNARKKDRATP